MAASCSAPVRAAVTEGGQNRASSMWVATAPAQNCHVNLAFYFFYSWATGRNGNSSRPRGVFIQSVSLTPFPWYINYFGSSPAVPGDNWWQWEPVFNLHCSGCTLCSCRLLSARLSGKGSRHLPAAPPGRLLPAQGRHSHSCLCPSELSLHPLHLWRHHRHPPGSSQRLPSILWLRVVSLGVASPMLLLSVCLLPAQAEVILSNFPLFQWMVVWVNSSESQWWGSPPFLLPQNIPAWNNSWLSVNKFQVLPVTVLHQAALEAHAAMLRHLGDPSFNPDVICLRLIFLGFCG